MFRDKLKNIIPKSDEQEGNDKKKIENLVFFIIILILTIVIINIIWNKDTENSNEQTTNSTSKQLATISENNKIEEETDQQESTNLEEKLENILSNIQGVGEVKVCINYSESSEVVAMYNENSKTSTTEETDTSGGNRKIQETDSQKDIIFQEEDGEKTPITQKIVQAKIEGAIIAAKGAGNATIKTSIIQAVEALTGLATHKIQVFEMQ